jgi:hypothetical protein
MKKTDFNNNRNRCNDLTLNYKMKILNFNKLNNINDYYNNYNK